MKNPSFFFWKTIVNSEVLKIKLTSLYYGHRPAGSVGSAHEIKHDINLAL